MTWKKVREGLVEKDLKRMKRVKSACIDELTSVLYQGIRNALVVHESCMERMYNIEILGKSHHNCFKRGNKIFQRYMADLPMQKFV